MPLRTETVDLDDARADVYEQMADVAEQQVEWQHDADKSEALLDAGQQLQGQHNALGWAMAEWDVDTVTFATLSEGERNYVANFCEDHPDVSERVPYVAIGTHDAPYLCHDPGAINSPDFDSDFEATVATLVSEVPVPFIAWAESKIGDLTQLGDESGNEYMELVREKQADESTDATGTTSVAPQPSPTDTGATQ